MNIIRLNKDIERQNKILARLESIPSKLPDFLSIIMRQTSAEKTDTVEMFSDVPEAVDTNHLPYLTISTMLSDKIAYVTLSGTLNMSSSASVSTNNSNQETIMELDAYILNKLRHELICWSLFGEKHVEQPLGLLVPGLKESWIDRTPDFMCFKDGKLIVIEIATTSGDTNEKYLEKINAYKVPLNEIKEIMNIQIEFYVIVVSHNQIRTNLQVDDTRRSDLAMMLCTYFKLGMDINHSVRKISEDFLLKNAFTYSEDDKKLRNSFKHMKGLAGIPRSDPSPLIMTYETVRNLIVTSNKDGANTLDDYTVAAMNKATDLSKDELEFYASDIGREKYLDLQMKKLENFLNSVNKIPSVLEKEGFSHRTDMKSIVQLSLMKPKIKIEHKSPEQNLNYEYVSKNLPIIKEDEPMARYWKAAIASARNNQSNFNTLSETEFSSIVQMVSSASDKKRQTTHRKSKGLVTINQDEEMIMYAALLGPGAKRMVEKEDPLVLNKKKKDKMPFSLDSDTTDVSLFVDDMTIYEVGENEFSYINEDVKPLYEKARQNMLNTLFLNEDEKSKMKFSSLDNQALHMFMSTMARTNMFQSLFVLHLILSEVNVSLSKFGEDSKFIIKKLHNCDVWILIKTTTNSNHIFFSVLYSRKQFDFAFENSEIGLPFKKPRIVNDDYVIYDFMSITQVKMDHYLDSHWMFVANTALWLDLYKISPSEFCYDSQKRKITSRYTDCLKHANFSMLCYLESKGTTSSSILNFRYSYMSCLRNNYVLPSPFDVIDKMEKRPKSRLLPWIYRKYIEANLIMIMNPPVLLVGSEEKKSNRRQKLHSQGYTKGVSSFNIDDLILADNDASNTIKKIKVKILQHWKESQTLSQNMFPDSIDEEDYQNKENSNENNYDNEDSEKQKEKANQTEESSESEARTTLKDSDFENEDAMGIEYCGIISYITKSELQNYEIALNISYIGSYHNKDDSDRTAAEFKIFSKVIQQELLMRKMDTENLFTKKYPTDKFDFENHSFDPQFAFLIGKNMIKRLEKTNLDWKSDFSKNLVDLFNQRNIEFLSTLKASAKIPVDLDKKYEPKTENEKKKALMNEKLKVAEAMLNMLLKETMHNIDNKILYSSEQILKMAKDIGFIYATLFKKAQLNGVREIFILDIVSRLSILISECIMRAFCRLLPNEMLEHGPMKNERMESHEKRRKREVRANKFKFSTTANDSVDQTTWCQRFVMGVFGSFITGVTIPEEDSKTNEEFDEFVKRVDKNPDSHESFMHNILSYVLNILNLVTKKRLELPKVIIEKYSMHEDDPKYSSICSDEINELRSQFLTEDEIHDIINFRGRYIKNLSNFMQGILHYLSSLLHAAYLIFTEDSNQKMVEMMLNSNKKYNDRFKLIETTAASSDDAAMMRSILYNNPASAFIVLFALRVICKATELMYNKLTIKPGTKAVFFATGNLVEFNSRWYIANTVLTPLIKFPVTSIKPKNIPRFDGRMHVNAGLRKVIIENGGTTFLASVIQIIQYDSHYQFFGSLLNANFPDYAKKLLKLQHPAFGFLPIEPNLASGIVGADFMNYLNFQSSQECQLTQLTINESSEFDFGELGGVSLGLSIVIGNHYRYQVFRNGIEKKINKFFPDEKFTWKDHIIANPGIMFGYSRTVLDSVARVAKMVSNPMTASSFSYPSVSKYMRVSVYSLQFACVSRALDLREKNLKIQENKELLRQTCVDSLRSIEVYLSKPLEPEQIEAATESRTLNLKVIDMLDKNLEFDEETSSKVVFKQSLLKICDDYINRIAVLIRKNSDLAEFTDFESDRFNALKTSRLISTSGDSRVVTTTIFNKSVLEIMRKSIIDLKNLTPVKIGNQRARRLVVIKMQRDDFDFTISLINVIRYFWYDDKRVTHSRTEMLSSLANYRAVIPWLSETFAESLLLSPYKDDPMKLIDFVISQSIEQKTLTSLAPIRRGSSLSAYVYNLGRMCYTRAEYLWSAKPRNKTIYNKGNSNDRVQMSEIAEELNDVYNVVRLASGNPVLSESSRLAMITNKISHFVGNTLSHTSITKHKEIKMHLPYQIRDFFTSIVLYYHSITDMSSVGKLLESSLTKLRELQEEKKTIEIVQGPRKFGSETWLSQKSRLTEEIEDQNLKIKELRKSLETKEMSISRFTSIFSLTHWVNPRITYFDPLMSDITMTLIKNAFSDFSISSKNTLSEFLYTILVRNKILISPLQRDELCSEIIEAFESTALSPPTKKEIYGIVDICVSNYTFRIFYRRRSISYMFQDKEKIPIEVRKKLSKICKDLGLTSVDPYFHKIKDSIIIDIRGFIDKKIEYVDSSLSRSTRYFSSAVVPSIANAQVSISTLSFNFGTDKLRVYNAMKYNMMTSEEIVKNYSIFEKSDETTKIFDQMSKALKEIDSSVYKSTKDSDDRTYKQFGLRDYSYEKTAKKDASSTDRVLDTLRRIGEIGFKTFVDVMEEDGLDPESSFRSINVGLYKNAMASNKFILSNNYLEPNFRIEETEIIRSAAKARSKLEEIVKIGDRNFYSSMRRDAIGRMIHFNRFDVDEADFSESTYNEVIKHLDSVFYKNSILSDKLFVSDLADYGNDDKAYAPAFGKNIKKKRVKDSLNKIKGKISIDKFYAQFEQSMKDFTGKNRGTISTNESKFVTANGVQNIYYPTLTCSLTINEIHTKDFDTPYFYLDPYLSEFSDDPVLTYCFKKFSDSWMSFSSLNRELTNYMLEGLRSTEETLKEIVDRIPSSDDKSSLQRAFVNDPEIAVSEVKSISPAMISSKKGDSLRQLNLIRSISKVIHAKISMRTSFMSRGRFNESKRTDFRLLNQDPMKRSEIIELENVSSASETMMNSIAASVMQTNDTSMFSEAYISMMKLINSERLSDSDEDNDYNDLTAYLSSDNEDNDKATDEEKKTSPSMKHKIDSDSFGNVKMLGSELTPREIELMKKYAPPIASFLADSLSDFTKKQVEFFSDAMEKIDPFTYDVMTYSNLTFNFLHPVWDKFTKIMRTQKSLNDYKMILDDEYKLINPNTEELSLSSWLCYNDRLEIHTLKKKSNNSRNIRKKKLVDEYSKSFQKGEENTDDGFEYDKKSNNYKSKKSKENSNVIRFDKENLYDNLPFMDEYDKETLFSKNTSETINIKKDDIRVLFRNPDNEDEWERIRPLMIINERNKLFELADHFNNVINISTKDLSIFLADNNLKIIDVNGDGSCFYHSIANHFYNKSPDMLMTAREMRNNMNTYFQENSIMLRQHFLDIGKPLIDEDYEIIRVINQEWANQSVVLIAAAYYRVNILVLYSRFGNNGNIVSSAIQHNGGNDDSIPMIILNTNNAHFEPIMDLRSVKYNAT